MHAALDPRAGQVVADPLGPPAVIPTGNAGMASGGMGDVLTGVIAALWAQGLPALADVSTSALAGTVWYPIEQYFGLLPLIAGSVLSHGSSFSTLTRSSPLLIFSMKI